jgi:hypothetical protein
VLKQRSAKRLIILIVAVVSFALVVGGAKYLNVFSGDLENKAAEVTLEDQWPPAEITWDYAQIIYDLTHEAVYGNADDLKKWQEEPKASIQADAEFLIQRIDASLEDQATRTTQNAEVKELTFTLSSPLLAAKLSYSIEIWTPNRSNRSSFPIVAFDGHGDCGGTDCTGDAPKRMFAEDGFARQLVDLGYTVIGFPTAIHEPFEELAKDMDYPTVWAALAKVVLDTDTVIEDNDSSYAVVGNAIGGLTALSLSIIDPNSLATVTNGAFFPLELTRRDYRIKDHPFCHDFRNFYSYTAVYALLAPRPLMIQMGVDDSLWLGHGPVPASDWFSGLKRGATADETLGAVMLLETIWQQRGETSFEFSQHNKGHEDMQFDLIDNFLSSNLAF